MKRCNDAVIMLETRNHEGPWSRIVSAGDLGIVAAQAPVVEVGHTCIGWCRTSLEPAFWNVDRSVFDSDRSPWAGVTEKRAEIRDACSIDESRHVQDNGWDSSGR